MNDQYELIPSGTFEDGMPAYKVKVLETFTLFNTVIPSGLISEFRIDEHTVLNYSWMFKPGDIRNAAIEFCILGVSRESNNCLIEHVILRSCLLKASQVIIRNADLNNVKTRAIRFFAMVGSPSAPMLLHGCNTSLSVSNYSIEYSEYKLYIEKVNEQ